MLTSNSSTGSTDVVCFSDIARESKELTNRKKVFYTLTFMQAPGGGNYGHAVDEDAFRKGFEPAFIDLERVGEPRIVPHVEVFDRPSWIGENFPPAADRTMNIGLVDSITQNPVELTVRFTPEAVEDVFPIDKKGLVFDLGHGIKHATVAIRKRSKRGPCQPYVTLKGDAESGYEIHTRAGVIATKGKVALEDLEIEVALLGYNCASGISTGSATLCAVAHKERDYPERMEDVVRRTLAHEAGHYLGIATRFSPHLTSELNVRYYDETYHVGGIGPHCSFPERIVESNALPATPGCVMYHSHADALDFCPDCVEALRLRQNTGGRIDGRREPF